MMKKIPKRGKFDVKFVKRVKDIIMTSIPSRDNG